MRTETIRGSGSEKGSGNDDDNELTNILTEQTMLYFLQQAAAVAADAQAAAQEAAADVQTTAQETASDAQAAAQETFTTQTVMEDVPPQKPFEYSGLIMIGLMVLVLWLFMWRPESKRRKQMQQFRNNLKKGDKIITAGGIYGTVKEIKEASLLIEVDSNVTLRIDKNMVVADNSDLQQK